MLRKIFAIYKNHGVKPALKAVRDALLSGSVRREHRAYYDSRSACEAGTIPENYVIIQTASVKLHAAYEAELAKAVRDKAPALIYTDELRNGYLLFKPNYAPDNLASHNYIGNCVAVRKSIMDERAWELAGQDNLWEFNKYIAKKCGGGDILHIAKALFEDGAYTENGQLPDKRTAGQTEPEVPVSILIPNCDHVEDLRRCVESILFVNDYSNYEILIIENNSNNEETFAYYKELEQRFSDKIRILYRKGEFNYSAINNYGAGEATGELLLLLNNDTKIIAPDSIRSMAAYAVRDNTGAVGACLIYADKTIQHAGIIVGIGPGGIAVHPNAGVPYEEDGYRDSIHHTQNYSAVTGACLMVKKSLYEQVNGLDEGLAVAYNDVDFCMKLRKRNLLNVYVPEALLYHYESKSRGYDDKGKRRERLIKEAAYFKNKWKAVLEEGDPYYNPNLSKNTPWKFDVYKADRKSGI